MNSQDEPYVVKNLTIDHIYYIFRPDGSEVKVEIKDNFIRPEVKLTDEEMKYFRDNILKIN